MKQITIFFLLSLIPLSACREADPTELIRVDQEFSALSREKGMKHAFLTYAADSVVLLQSQAMPLVGKKSMAGAFEGFADTGFTLTWEPLFADISHSGDLGYTYGLYTRITKADSSTTRGKYVTIWRRQQDGEWKYVLDGGNEGL
jgi:ketosteroid isomerase-like protein